MQGPTDKKKPNYEVSALPSKLAGPGHTLNYLASKLFGYLVRQLIQINQFRIGLGLIMEADNVDLICSQNPKKHFSPKLRNLGWQEGWVH